MPVFVDQFGGVQTAYIGYAAYDLNFTPNPYQLYWPTSYVNTTDLVAAYMDFNNTGVSGGKQVQLPDATQVSVGQNFILTNRDTETMFLLDFTGATIDSIASGVSRYYILTNNSTSGGSWHILTFGAGTSESTASQLVGYGLNSLVIGASDGTKLNVEIEPTLLANGITTYDILPTDYTSLLIWTSGSGNIYLPATASAPTPPQVPPAYYVGINNAGNGILTVYPNLADIGTGIQGQTSLTLNPQQTLILISNGDAQTIQGLPTKWFTLGFGQQPTQQITYTAIPVGGNTNIYLNSTNVSNQIIEFTGTLTGDIFVYFPQRQGQWSLFNNTTGGFTLTIQLVNTVPIPIGTPYTIPQGNRDIYYSNGASLFDIPEPLSPGGTVTSVNAASTTGLTITGVPITTSGTIDINLPTGTATQVLAINTTGPQTLHWVTPTTGTVTLVGSGTGLIGGPITNSGTLSIANTGVVAGSYTSPDLTINAQGQITAASSNFALVVLTNPGTAIDLSTVGNTIIATTASTAGKIFLPLSINIYTYDIDETVSPDAQISIGTNSPDYDNLLSAMTLTQIDGLGNESYNTFVNNSAGSTAPILNPSQDITFRVRVAGSTGDTYFVIGSLTGYYTDEP